MLPAGMGNLLTGCSVCVFSGRRLLEYTQFVDPEAYGTAQIA